MFELTYCLHDLLNIHKHMHWGDERRMTVEQLQAKLLFYYHKIEKGMSMPGKKRLFALDVIPKIIQILDVWEFNGNDLKDPIYLGAISSLRSYEALLVREALDEDGKIISSVHKFLVSRDVKDEEQQTPIMISAGQIDSTVSYEEFRNLCQLRRSFRDYSDKDVTHEVIQQAVQLAQLSPTACNRQPCKVYVIRENELKKKVLKHQNGNVGFGHLAPIVIIITSNTSSFFGAIERHQPYVDGGLFSMTLMYALQVQGIVTCCLNWCVKPSTDSLVHSLMCIPDSENIMMLMLAGYPNEQTIVPKSHRKALESVLFYR